MSADDLRKLLEDMGVQPDDSQVGRLLSALRARRPVPSSSVPGHALSTSEGPRPGTWSCLCSCGWTITLPFPTEAAALHAGRLHQSIAPPPRQPVEERTPEVLVDGDGRY